MPRTLATRGTWYNAAAAYATGDYTMQEIATFFRVHYATVSRTVKEQEF